MTFLLHRMDSHIASTRFFHLPAQQPQQLVETANGPAPAGLDVGNLALTEGGPVLMLWIVLTPQSDQVRCVGSRVWHVPFPPQNKTAVSVDSSISQGRIQNVYKSALLQPVLAEYSHPFKDSSFKVNSPFGLFVLISGSLTG
jgi:hypothetical protein